MTAININDQVSADIQYSVNSVDQCTINTLHNLNLNVFDKVDVYYDTKKIFSGYVVDIRYSTSFGQKNYEYTINSPLWKLTKEKCYKGTMFMSIFIKQCADLCGLNLDYDLAVNPIIPLEETSYFDMLKRCIYYSKDMSSRFYVDHEGNNLVFTNKNNFYIGGYVSINYEYEYDTEIINQVIW